MKQILAIALIFSCTSSTLAQNSLNDYKYVIVPYKYDFLNEKDKYQLNSLSQFLFNKYGFNAIMEDADFPEELIKNRCLGLRSDIIKGRGAFTTNLQVQLKNCNGDVIYTTKTGSTREKQYKTAYTIATREAFKDFEYVNYTYKPNENILARATIKDTGEASTKEIQKLKEEIKALKEKKQKEEVVVNTKEIVVEKPPKKELEVKKMVVEEPTVNVLYAQKIGNGYQIVDKTPKVVMILLVTNLANVFLVKGKDAIVYKEDGLWYHSWNDGKLATIETLNIKF
jgi:hypothetical protein